MPELLLELFSEEIPARMQARGADDLARLLREALAPLAPAAVTAFAGPRRIAAVLRVAHGVPETRQSERGPRVSAPEQALAGFLRKHGAAREALRQEGEFWILDRVLPGMPAATLIARELPALLRRFPWPKSMRWGESAFTWVRPLRRILCLLDGAVVPFDLRQGDDEAHSLAAGDQSEGHRFLAPGAFTVTSAMQWQDELRRRSVIVDAAERREAIARGVEAAASAEILLVADDPGLLDEVTGLVEWPVPLLGRIGEAFMDLPPEVMQVSMRVNQRYFALRDAAGQAAPRFAFVANIPGAPDPAAIVTGNERVLRARFSDARHFWELDRQRTLASRVPDLDAVTFHAKLGSQGDRVRRLIRIAGEIAPLVGANVGQTTDAALLCKADLTTGMVGEFPELQGVMGSYYAEHDGYDKAVCLAIRDHYLPRGPEENAPRAKVTVAVALADKLDQLVQFFSQGEKPTGGGDPLALRRAGLGVIHLIAANEPAVGIRKFLACAGWASGDSELLDFLLERLRVLWRGQGKRHDLLAAAMATVGDNLRDLTIRVDALQEALSEEEGSNLLAGYRRAANILRIENGKDGPHDAAVNDELFVDPAETVLWRAVRGVGDSLQLSQPDETAVRRMFDDLASLRGPLDVFFARVTVNSPRADLRANRLRLLNAVVKLMNSVVDFSRIEGGAVHVTLAQATASAYVRAARNET